MARIGQVGEGLSLLEKAVALDASAEPQITRSLTLIAFAEALLLAGEHEKALTAVNEALDRTRTLEERAAEGHACWLRGTIDTVRALDLEAAASMFERATEIATQLNLRPLVAHCHLGFADLYERRGLQAEAATFRNLGQGLLHELGMKRWLKA